MVCWWPGVKICTYWSCRCRLSGRVGGRGEMSAAVEGLLDTSQYLTCLSHPFHMSVGKGVLTSTFQRQNCFLIKPLLQLHFFSRVCLSPCLCLLCQAQGQWGSPCLALAVLPAGVEGQRTTAVACRNIRSLRTELGNARARRTSMLCCFLVLGSKPA